MHINGYENITCPDTAFCYKHNSVNSYTLAKEFFSSSGIAISFDGGIIFSLDKLDMDISGFTFSNKIPYSGLPKHVQIDLNKQLIKKKLCDMCLIEKSECLYFSKDDSELPPKRFTRENLFINFGFSISLLSIQDRELLLVDPKMVVTKDGKVWDHDFAVANYTILNKNPMQYGEFLKIINTVRKLLGEEFSISTESGNYKYKIPRAVNMDEIKITGSEPEISFGTGMSDTFPAAGLKRYGPRDYNLSASPRPKDIKIGIISERDDFPILSGVRGGETGKKYPFPGFKRVYKTDLIGSKSWISKITESDLLGCKTEDELSTLFKGKLQNIKENCDVYVIELPISAPMQIAGLNLRDFLKVLFWKERKGSQIILRITEDKLTDLVVDNLALGIYVSAGGQPWILEEPCEDQVFIGISFGKSSNNRTLIGTVEVFDSYGVSLGMSVSEIKTLDRDIYERDYHLSEEQLEELIRNSIKRYVYAYKKDPLKLTIHKTSPFDDKELIVLESLKDLAIDINFLYVNSRGKDLYLINEDNTLPKRLRYWMPESNKAFLYTKGNNEQGWSIDPFIPKPMYIELQAKNGQSNYSIDEACQDIIKLTKLNWNSVASYEREPVTISHSRKIIDLLRCDLSLDDAPRDVKYFI